MDIVHSMHRGLMATTQRTDAIYAYAMQQCNARLVYHRSMHLRDLSYPSRSSVYRCVRSNQPVFSPNPSATQTHERHTHLQRVRDRRRACSAIRTYMRTVPGMSRSFNGIVYVAARVRRWSERRRPFEPSDTLAQSDAGAMPSRGTNPHRI